MISIRGLVCHGVIYLLTQRSIAWRGGREERREGRRRRCSPEDMQSVPLSICHHHSTILLHSGFYFQTSVTNYALRVSLEISSRGEYGKIELTQNDLFTKSYREKKLNKRVRIALLSCLSARDILQWLKYFYMFSNSFE